jgi:hypothetical protein
MRPATRKIRPESAFWEKKKSGAGKAAPHSQKNTGQNGYRTAFTHKVKRWSVCRTGDDGKENVNNDE